MKTATLAADWYLLVGPWTPLVALLFLGLWARACSSIFDKDAVFWHFNRDGWNMAHLLCGTLGFAIMVLPVPEPWWPAVGFPLGLMVMFGSSVAYWVHHNKNTPEDEHFKISTEAIRERLATRAAARSAKAAAVALVDSKGVAHGLPAKDDPAFPIHIAMEDMLTPAFVQRASAVDLVPGKSGQYHLSQLVDGVRYRRDPVDPAVASAVIDYLKRAAGTDVADKRRRQMGDCSARFGIESHELRVRTAGSSAGQTMTIDIDLKKRINMKPDDLGLHPKQVEALTKATSDLHGIILVSAPPGGGRTTSLYAFLRRHDAFTANIRTLEYEHLLQIDGVGHSEFKPSEGVEFSIQLRSILRRDPTIVMIEDLTDARTAQEAAAPGMRGPLMYIGLRAETGLEALAKWAKAVGDLPKAAAPLKAVTSERLMRRLCENCRLAYQPDANQLRRLGLPPDKVRQLFKPFGKIVKGNREEPCPMCGGLGYRGQTAAFEVMEFDDEARALLARGDLNGVKTHMRRLKTMSLQEAALFKAIEGVTSIEEVIRVTRPPAPAAPKSEAESAPAEAGAAVANT